MYYYYYYYYYYCYYYYYYYYYNYYYHEYYHPNLYCECGSEHVQQYALFAAQTRTSHTAWVQIGQHSQSSQPVQRARHEGLAKGPATTPSVLVTWERTALMDPVLDVACERTYHGPSP